MTKYQEASKCYIDMVQCWKMFQAGRNKDHAHGQIVNDAIRLAQLDLPDPFAALDNGIEEPASEAAPVEKKVEDKEVIKVENKEVNKEVNKEANKEVKPIEAKFKPEERSYNNWSKNYKK